ncbi:MAG: hypothetical protein QM756_04465 [Polyangiaceae bacterium]
MPVGQMARIEALITILDRSKGRLAIAFGLALLVHFPLTPALPMLRLAHRLTKGDKVEPPPPAQLVDVELREALKSDEKRKEEPPAPTPKAASMQVDPPSNVKFAAGAPKPEPEEKSEEKAKEVKKDKVKSVGLEGDMSKKLLGKPPVTLGLWLSSLRENPLGQKLGEIMACDREWKRFIDQGVDILKDFDGMLVVGPSLYESGQLTAAVRHNLPPERVHGIMQSLVESSGERGSWLMPDVASARLGRSQRVLLPQSKDVFFVTPNKGWEALKKTKEPLRVPSAEGRTASLVLVNPNRALSRLGLTLPKRIQEMRLEVFANADESVDLKVELEATTPDAARDEEKRVASQMREFFSDVWTAATALRAIAGTSAGESHLELAPRLDLEVEEQVLSGMAHLSPQQARATLELLASFTCRKKPPKAK